MRRMGCGAPHKTAAGTPSDEGRQRRYNVRQYTGHICNMRAKDSKTHRPATPRTYSRAFTKAVTALEGQSLSCLGVGSPRRVYSGRSRLRFTPNSRRISLTEFLYQR